MNRPTVIVSAGLQPEWAPADARLEGTSEGSPDVARCGLKSYLAGPMEAGRGLARLGICGRWLPRWLPEIPLASLTFERSNLLATRYRRRASSVPLGLLACQLGVEDLWEMRALGLPLTAAFDRLTPGDDQTRADMPTLPPHSHRLNVAADSLVFVGVTHT